MKRQRSIILFFILCLIAAAILFFFYYQQREESEGIVLYGNVDVRQVNISFRVAGRVVEMPFEEGDLVPKDALMGTLEKQPYEDQVAQAKANVESIQLNLDNAEKLYQRRKELIDNGSVSKEELENVLNSRDVYQANLQEAKASLGVAEKNLKDIEVFSPSEGTILTRVREPGSVVNVGDPIYTLSLVSPVWIRVFISEPYLGDIYPGMHAEIYTNVDGGKVYTGQVGFISPIAEFTPKTVESTELRSDLVYRLRVVADNPDRFLKQGMPVTVKLFDKKNETAQ